MKKITTTVIFILIVACLLCVTSCESVTNTLETVHGMKKAAHLVYDFWDAIETGDFERAQNMLHSSSEVSVVGLETYLSNIEQEFGMDFSDDFYIMNDSTMISTNESFERAYVTKCSLVVNDTGYILYVLTVYDTQGFGIYSFEIVE